ncbi:MAG: hypothetical protein KDC53_10990, partial [Saprospiraceae bacterium]|nr:hypothetical protein [Saprospiraceae bacterium]
MHQYITRSYLVGILFVNAFLYSSLELYGQEFDLPDFHLAFHSLPLQWDEGIPQGNGVIGTLLWKKGENLRMSLDRSDLWDLRPMKNLDFSRFDFQWVREQWKGNTYEKVQEWMDIPYEQRPAPTKIPGGALEFPIKYFGPVHSVDLDVRTGVCLTQWDRGIRLQTYVHAVDPVGFFKFEGLDDDLDPILVAPAYADSVGELGNINSVEGQSLQLLGYRQGEILKLSTGYSYRQEGWNGFHYEIYVSWKRIGKTIEGCWSIKSSLTDAGDDRDLEQLVKNALDKGYDAALPTHLEWWKQFWAKSSILIPNKTLEKQWYLEMYKFGSLARKDAPPISLQGVWTADNGKIPPWKGDFHHDLNTELSYWPAYSANHLDLEEGFINWLWKYKDTFKRYTREYFKEEGLNVPGVTTLAGEPMGGWIQYSLGPTVSAWLAHHFYLHWKFSGDHQFLESKAYPWVKDVADYLESIAIKDEGEYWKLPLSASPEINNNSKEAWFAETTNFDLALIRWLFQTAVEMADTLHLQNEAEHWSSVLNKWPDLALDATAGLLIAPNYPFQKSHRHFSHLMAIHPLGLLDWSDGEPNQQIIRNSLKNLKALGPSEWTGYSYSWLANLEARMLDGASAAKSLEIFSKAFCLPNSFHVNGDQ